MSAGNDSLDSSFFTWAEEMEAQEAWAEERGAPEASIKSTAPADTVPSTNEDDPQAEDKPTAKKKQTARDKLREFESKGHGTVSFVASLVAVREEFEYRNELLDLPGGQNIHHFNWFGECLPKQPHASRDVSLTATKNNAEKWVDPIVIRVDNGVCLPQDADDLLRFAKSRTQKMYTPHGRWQSDREDRQTFCDDGEPSIYMKTGMMVGNGFIEGTSIRTRANWLRYGQLLNAVELEDLKIAEKGEEIPAWYRRAHASEFKRPSPLSRSMTPEDLEDDYKNTDNAVQDGDSSTWVAADDVETAPAEPTYPRRSALRPSIFTIPITPPAHDCDSLKPGWSAIKR